MTKAIIVRDDGTIGPGGLRLIEDMAATNKTQGTIAATLGLSKKKFEKMLERNKGENPERIAWERGRAAIEQKLLDSMMASATGELMEEDVLDKEGQPVLDEVTGQPKRQWVRVQSKTGGIHAIFLAKSQFGWNEKGGTMNVTDNRIQIVMPAPMERGQLLHALGQSAPLDFRKNKDTPLPIRDVTPPKPEGES